MANPGPLQQKGEEGQIHNGADDNASGVAAVLELARCSFGRTEATPGEVPARHHFRFLVRRGTRPDRFLLLCGTPGRACSPTSRPMSISTWWAACVTTSWTCREWVPPPHGGGWRKSATSAAGFNLVLQEDPYLPTDVTAFYPKQVPVVNFFTGSHENYHRPTDDAETLNYEGLERITKFARQPDPGSGQRLTRGRTTPRSNGAERAAPAGTICGCIWEPYRTTPRRWRA